MFEISDLDPAALKGKSGTGSDVYSRPIDSLTPPIEMSLFPNSTFQPPARLRTQRDPPYFISPSLIAFISSVLIKTKYAT